MHRLKTKVGDLLTPGDKAPWPNVCKRLNRLLSGWEAYFSYGSRSLAYQAVDPYVCDRVRRFLAKRRKVQNRGTRSFSRAKIFGELGVRQLRRLHQAPSPWASP